MDEVRLIEVKEGVFSENEKIADQVRSDLAERGVLLLNLMSSPGAGKTTLILETIKALGDDLKLGVLEADIDAVVDAERVAAAGVPAVQLRTGGFCHLDATMVTQGLEALPLDDLDVVIIENVGNLVCPAEFDTGAHKNVMILSVPEGDDKPFKYPLMFSLCDVILISKIDSLSCFEFDFEVVKARILKLNPKAEIFELSAKTGAGVTAWVEWLRLTFFG
jgi:hydrogenase nickel incorporation protein HypB